MKTTVPIPQVGEVVKQFFWLAWEACGGPTGMGFFQDNPSATPDAVLHNVMGAGDYSGTEATCTRGDGELYADYVFGRMMKVGIKIRRTGDTSELEVSDARPRLDYQGWSQEYSSYEQLLTTAVLAAAKGN